MYCNPAARCYFTVQGLHTNGAGLVILFQTVSKNGGPLFKQGLPARSPRNFKHHYKQEADDSDNDCASTPPQVTDAATVLNMCVDSSLKVASTPSFTTEKKNPTASKSTVRKATPLRRPIAEKNTPKQGTMDSFFDKFKRKLSPDKESDGQSGATKQIRNNEPDK